jgi:hypothetical protein
MPKFNYLIAYSWINDTTRAEGVGNEPIQSAGPIDTYKQVLQIIDHIKEVHALSDVVILNMMLLSIKDE